MELHERREECETRQEEGKEEQVRKKGGKGKREPDTGGCRLRL